MTDGCVRFTKESWHFRLVNFVFLDMLLEYYANAWHTRPISLCPYMRAVVASIILVPFIAVWRHLPMRVQDNAWITQGELIFLFMVMIVAFLVGWNDDMKGDIFPPFLEMVGIGFIGGNIIAVIGFCLIAGCIMLKDYIQDRPKKEHKTRGLLKEYMEAKHDKICPCVEFVD